MEKEPNLILMPTGQIVFSLDSYRYILSPNTSQILPSLFIQLRIPSLSLKTKKSA